MVTQLKVTVPLVSLRDHPINIDDIRYKYMYRYIKLQKYYSIPNFHATRKYISFKPGAYMNLVDLFSQFYFFTDHVMRGLQIKLFIRPITFLFSGSTTEINVALWRLQSELLESENIRKTILVDFC